MKTFTHSFLLTLSSIYMITTMLRWVCSMFSNCQTTSTAELVLYGVCSLYVITFALINTK